MTIRNVSETRRQTVERVIRKELADDKAWLAMHKKLSRALAEQINGQRKGA